MNRDEGIGSFGLGAPRRSHRRLAVPEGEPLGLGRGRGNRRHRHRDHEAGKQRHPNELGQPNKQNEAMGHRRHSVGF
jgi:hypothetical protein